MVAYLLGDRGVGMKIDDGLGLGDGSRLHDLANVWGTLRAILSTQGSASFSRDILKRQDPAV
jgi:hypothetical protein